MAQPMAPEIAQPMALERVLEMELAIERFPEEEVSLPEEQAIALIGAKVGTALMPLGRAG